MNFMVRKKNRKRRTFPISSFLKLTVLLGYLYILLFITLEIVETHYFDKLFYLKSWIHGYYFPEKDSQNTIAKLLAGVNSEGFRDNEFRPKQKGEFLILVVGDSNVWGWGVRKSNRFTQVLEKELSKIKKTRIISLGKGGNNVYLNQKLAKEYEKKLNPDLVVFTFYENDLLIRPEQEALINKLTDNKDIIREFNIGDPMEEYYPRVLGSYDEKTANFQAFLKTIPSLDRGYLYYYLSYAPQISHDKLAYDLMKNEGLKIINNNVLYRLKYASLASNKNNKESEELTISNMEGHPNPIAHLMFAERLFAEITCNSELGFTNKCSKFSPGRINFLTFLEKI